MIAEGLATYGHSVRIHSLLGRKHDMLRGKPQGIAYISEKILEFVQRSKWLWVEAMVSYKRNRPPFWATKALNNPTIHLKSDAEWADTIIFDFPFSFCEIAQSNQLKILNTHNIEENIFNALDDRQKNTSNKVAQQEIQAINKVNLVCCASVEESTHFSALAPNQRFIVIPNCVDRRRFHDLSIQRETVRHQLGINAQTRALLFPASRYAPNQEGFDFLSNFAERNSDLLEELDLTFVVTGSVTKKPLKSGRLIATGPVPEIEPYFGVADWGLNPIFKGSGTSIKVAEMIAAELPLLTTAVGARGFDLTNQEDVIFFDRETFAETLKKLPINHQHLRKMTSQAAVKNARYFDPHLAVESLHQAIDRSFRIVPR
jgi:glycosyltransferase involved in cell wall biosynthesis